MKSTEKALLALRKALKEMDKSKLEAIIRKVDEMEVEDGSPTIFQYLSEFDAQFYGMEIEAATYGIEFSIDNSQISLTTMNISKFVETAVETMIFKLSEINLPEFIRPEQHKFTNYKPTKTVA